MKHLLLMIVVSFSSCLFFDSTPTPTDSDKTDSGIDGGGSLCGNGILDKGEECDSKNFGTPQCEDLGKFNLFGSGPVSCSKDCTFELGSECGSCGQNENEECNSQVLEIANCGDATKGDSTGGRLTCTKECKYNTKDCFSCNKDNTVQPPEECDGTSLPKTQCSEFDSGYSGGKLSCLECTYNVADCKFCGDGIISGTEACDDNDGDPIFLTDKNTCFEINTKYSQRTGTLKCENCKIDVKLCTTPICGNDLAEYKEGQDDEVCDGKDLDGKKCTDLIWERAEKYKGGNLVCKGSCEAFDTSACHTCGNGTIESPETCDGTTFNTSCASGERHLGPCSKDCKDPGCGVIFTKVSAGDNRVCGLTSEGEIQCNGENPKSGPYIDVAVGKGFTCGIRKSEKVECWGTASDDIHQKATKIDAFNQRVCGIDTKGEIWCNIKLGRNINMNFHFNDLGVSETSVCGKTDTTSIQCANFGEGTGGFNHTGSSPDGGSNFQCYIDNGHEIICVPTNISYPSGQFEEVSAGGKNGVCGRKKDGSVECKGITGANPTQTFSAISVGNGFACGILNTTKDFGSIQCWGTNNPTMMTLKAK